MGINRREAARQERMRIKQGSTYDVLLSWCRKNGDILLKYLHPRYKDPLGPTSVLTSTDPIFELAMKSISPPIHGPREITFRRQLEAGEGTLQIELGSAEYLKIRMPEKNTVPQSQTSIGALWPAGSMSGPTPIPTLEERRALNALPPSPPIRVRILMRYKLEGAVWVVTFSYPSDSRPVRTCRFDRAELVEATARRGRGLTDLAARQALELGISQGEGAIFLELDDVQCSALEQPL